MKMPSKTSKRVPPPRGNILTSAIAAAFEAGFMLSGEGWNGEILRDRHEELVEQIKELRNTVEFRKALRAFKRSLVRSK